MTDLQERPSIPDELRDALGSAVEQFADWHWGTPSPKISYGQQDFSLPEICHGVELYSGQVPDSIYKAVHALAADLRDGPEGRYHPCDAPIDHSYASVARCLRQLYEARAAYFRELIRR
jgi:hypothetical protein